MAVIWPRSKMTAIAPRASKDNNRFVRCNCVRNLGAMTKMAAKIRGMSKVPMIKKIDNRILIIKKPERQEVKHE